MLVSGGRGPMSAKKFSKPCSPCQRAQTVIPRPPYKGQSSRLGFVQRVIMACQD